MIIGTVIAALAAWLLIYSYNQGRHMHEGCTKFMWLINRNHVQDKGYYINTPGYGRIGNGGVDGIRRKHGHVYVRCARCDKEFNLVNVHQHRDEPLTS